MNSVALIGRLTADLQTHAGEKHESATFRLAVPRKGSDGADFVDIVTFDKLAAICGEYLTKGREVAVVGRLHLNEWTSREGERRTRLQVSHPNETGGFAGDPGWPTPSSSSTPPRRPPTLTAEWPRPTSRLSSPTSAARPANRHRTGRPPNRLGGPRRHLRFVGAR